MARNIFFSFMVSIAIGIVLMLISRLIGLHQFAGNAGNPYLGLFVICLFWGMGGSVIQLLISKWMVRNMMGVQTINPNTAGDMGRLVQRVHLLAKGAGLNKMPEVGIYQSPEVNAFATGPSRNNSLVAVSTGLLEKMDSDEVEGVLAHEVAHVANGDMVTMTVIQGVVNAFVFFLAHILANIISSVLSRGDDEEGGGLGYFANFLIVNVLVTLLGFLAMPIVMWFSRWREYRADAGGAKLAGREKMIAALQRLKSTTELVDTGDRSMATLKISDKKSVMKLFASHPDLDDRIKALQMARN